MKIGVPKEIKNNEFRIGITPDGVQTLISHGHDVCVENNAGVGSGFSNHDYLKVGATIASYSKEVYQYADMIIKVKEPLPEEFDLIQESQLIYTFFHFASSASLTKAMIDRNAVCLAYETITDDQGGLPLLTPMSEVAGRLASQQGAKYLESPQGGLGVLMGGVSGVSPADVMILGGGVVGTQAALVAAGMGADVTIYDINPNRIEELQAIMPKNITTCLSSLSAIEKHLPKAHLVIGAVLVPGAKAPKLITRKQLRIMQKGAVLVDVAVDQGGCFETTKATTHQNPTYVVDDILHYAVANMPGAVPQTSTKALSNVTVDYAVKLANFGWQNACKQFPHLANGLNIVQGKVVHRSVAEVFSLPFVPVKNIL
ncbi:MAG: alanine dehydrogenase [Flavobacteriaceae bacterium]|nr:alanine dehydrogenase [Flavobacteriaceae bacterium]